MLETCVGQLAHPNVQLGGLPNRVVQRTATTGEPLSPYHIRHMTI